MSDNLVELHAIDKKFFHVQVLYHVSLSVKSGEVHALMGENGAGKSTLMKILGGVHQRDGGTIYWEGQEIEEMTPSIIKKLGISFVQEIYRKVKWQYASYNRVSGCNIYY